MRILVALMLCMVAGVASANGIASGTISTSAASGGGGGGSFACNDTIDNDGDGIADWPGDAGCTSPYDTSESGDALVTIVANLSAADLNTCIAGSSAPTGCDSTGAAAAVTVRTNGTRWTISGEWNPAQARVSLNHVYTGSVKFEEPDDHERLVDIIMYDNGFYFFGGDDYVIANSIFDADHASPGGCAASNQAIIWCDPAWNPPCDGTITDGIITGNFFTHFWINNSPVSCADAAHSEAIFMGGDNNGFKITNNDFEYNANSSHLTLTYFPQTYGSSHPRNGCVDNNTWGPRGSEFGQHCGGSDSSCETAFSDIGEYPDNGTYASVYVTPGQSASFAGCGGSCTNPTGGACRQCNDGIDNDGDGKADYWPDGLGDSVAYSTGGGGTGSGCTGPDDNSE